jgi:hypothetical protein
MSDVFPLNQIARLTDVTAPPQTYSSTGYVVEVGGETAGIVVYGRSGWKFFSSGRPFDCLDGQAFRSPSDAERAARNAWRQKRRPLHQH